MAFTHQLRVRYSECDAQAIVFNGNWFLYFDVVMTEFWRERMGGYDRLASEFGAEIVVAETGARFRGAARFDELIDFKAEITRVGDSSMRTEITATRGADLLCEGFLEYVFVDAASWRPTSIPDPVREALGTER